MRGAPLVVGKRPPAPRAQEAAYVRWSQGVLAIWAHTARDLLERSRTELVTRADITRAWEQLVSSAGLGAVLVRISGELTNVNRQYFRRTLKTVPPQPDTRHAREAFVRENVELWANLGNELADRLAQALAQTREDAKPAGVTRAVNKARKANVGLVSGLDVRQTLKLGEALKSGQEQGVRHETLIEQVQQITGYGESRSRLIARDQTVKHNAAVQQAQARAAGVTRYRWICVQNEATRPFHKKLNGTVHSYDNPPVTNKQGDRNNPGEDYQCRCTAAPIIDLFAGLSDG